LSPCDPPEFKIRAAVVSALRSLLSFGRALTRTISQERRGGYSRQHEEKAFDMAFHRAIRHRRLTAAIVALLLGLACGMASAPALAVDHPDLFQVTSPDFADGGMLETENAGTGTSSRGPWACGGADVSPGLAWSHAPAGTKSFAVIMDDPDAASGRGGTHWIMYDIAPNVASLARDAANHPGNFVAGDPGHGKVYSGPCAEPGAKAHHFIFMVYALDLAPGLLPPGMSRGEFIGAIEGHNLAEASIVAGYQRDADGNAVSAEK
jgi:Raf kinase inhibitor-like YbhB/YbcL family protein